jgi:hypothetical protein
MNYIKQRLAYAWEHRETIVGLLILLTIIICEITLLVVVIGESL